MYTKIYKGYKIFFDYAFDSYAVRPVGGAPVIDVFHFDTQDDCKKYADANPLKMDVMHDTIEEIKHSRKSVMAEFNVYMKEQPFRPLYTTMHARNERELLHKIAVYLGVTHRLKPDRVIGLPED